MTFQSFDLDLHPKTLILKPDLDMITVYLHAKFEVSSFIGSKVIIKPDRHTKPRDCPHSTVFNKTQITDANFND